MIGKLGQLMKDGVPMPEHVEHYAQALARAENLSIQDARWFALGAYTTLVGVYGAGELGSEAYRRVCERAHQAMERMAQKIEQLAPV
jgi:hypothetical protein